MLLGLEAHQLEDSSRALGRPRGDGAPKRRPEEDQAADVLDDGLCAQIVSALLPVVEELGCDQAAETVRDDDDGPIPLFNG